MADIEKVKQGLMACTTLSENGATDGDCKICPYDYGYKTGECWVQMNRDALSVIESQQAEIERMKAQKQRWLQNIADQQLAVSPTGYETEEGLAKRTGEWNGLQMAWEILTKE